MCFIFCWLVLILDEPLRFTPWGLVSGLFWVPGGVAGIFAIRNAGIAMAVGTWSSIIVLTSFTWGILVFEERVKSKSGAVGAVMMLICGLVGMAYFSGSKGNEDVVSDSTKEKRLKQLDIDGVDGQKSKLKAEAPQPKEEEGEEVADEEGMRKRQKINMKGTKVKGMKRKGGKLALDAPKEKSTGKALQSAPRSVPLTALEMESLLQSTPKEENSADLDKKNTVSLFNGDIVLTRRQAGLIAAAFNGLWGGTNLVPLHFAAQAGYGGPSYVISFACGSMVVTIHLWLIRFLYELYRLDGEWGAAYNALPSFHIRQMWFQGMLSGFLYSLGKFMSIISVTYLGQGVGYSFTQFSMLVSGLWGIFKFEEIKGQDRITNWFFSAVTAVMGILWLCYEHSSF
jgi:glucose uptake protein GlcU